MKEVVQKLFGLFTKTFAVCFLIVACSPKTSIIDTETETRIATQPSFQIVTKYSEPEIKVIPPPSFRKIFIPGMPVLVKTKDMEVLLRVTHYQANEYAIGLVEGQNKEIKISIDELKEISIVEEKIPKKKNKTEKVESKTYSSSEFSTAEEIVYSLPYLLVTPMLVTAPIIIPMTKSLESKWRKVDLIYKGITKNELITYLGEPEGKYNCSHVFGFGIPVREFQIWEYSNEKVLRGAELMFIELEQQEVYHSEGKWDLMFYNNWKSDHNCSVIIENNEP